LEAILRAALVAHAALALSGCVWFAGYPEAWPPLNDAEPTERSGCIAVGGIYDATGEYTPGWTGSQQVRLLHLLGGPQNPDLRHVVIHQTGDLIRIETEDADGSGEAFRFNRERGEFHCDRHEIVLAGRYESRPSAGDDVIVGYSWRTATLAKDAQGRLLIRANYGAAGLVYLLIPIFYWQGDWARFDPSDRARIGTPIRR